MSALPKIDMAEVTRLTRAGKLSEAVALLRGSPAAAAQPAGAAHEFDLSALAEKLPGAKLFKSQPLPPSGPGATPVPAPDGSAPSDGRFLECKFTSAVGSRGYKLFVPSGYAGKPLPLVVMLHGCSQDPDDFAAGTQMNLLAEAQNFLVAYPRQPQAANMQKCWNWFNTKDQQREGGEPSLIAGIVRQIVAEFATDPDRIYAAGLSAGGAAAAIMAATYPELFAAVGVHSGLACGAARDMASAFAAMSGHGAVAQRQGPPVPVIVFQGDADWTVNKANADQLVAQAQAGAAFTKEASRGQTKGGMGYTRTIYRDAAGDAAIELWMLHGAGHAWAGGRSSGSFTDPKGPDASREMIRFFLAHRNANRVLN